METWGCFSSLQPPPEGNLGTRTTVPPHSSSTPTWAVGPPREHSCPLDQMQLKPMHIYEGGILLKQLFMANTVSAKSGCSIEKLFFNEKQWNTVIYFVINVKVFFATHWTLMMALGALWSRRCYTLLSPMKLPGQTIFPMIYWRHPLLEWRMAFLYQITSSIWWVFHSVSLFPPY